MDAPSTESKSRILLVVLGVLAIAGISGMVLMRRFPNAFDRETVDSQQLDKVKTAKFFDTTAKADAGWPQWRGPLRDGRAPAGEFRTNWDRRFPRELWSVPCKGGYSSCTVQNGFLYTSDYDAEAKSERVICLEAQTGNPVWEYSSPADYSVIRGGYTAGPRATPTLHDGRLYVLGATGQFFCIESNPAPGKPTQEFWRHDLLAEFDAVIPTWGLASSPLIEGEFVIVQAGGKKGSVVAFDRKTGEQKWATGREVNGYSSPVAAMVAGERIVLAMTGNSLLGIRSQNGTQLFRYDWVTAYDGNIATPVVVEDWVFISSGYGKGCALLHIEKSGDTFLPKPVYFRPGKLMKNHHSSSVQQDGFLYGFDDNVLKCINMREGQEVWDSRGINKGNLILADKHLIGLTERGSLFLVQATPEAFRLIEQKDVLKGNDCWSAPVLVNGLLYLRDNTRIVCFDVRPE
jgi:outer membrane protein assembly factor BamB